MSGNDPHFVSLYSSLKIRKDCSRFVFISEDIELTLLAASILLMLGALRNPYLETKKGVRKVSEYP